MFRALRGHSFKYLFIFTQASVSAAGAAAIKCLPIIHYSVAYLFWSFVITDTISGILKIYLRLTDEA